MNSLLYPQFPDRRESGKTNIEQAHLVLNRMLRIFDFICRKHQIGYWLDYGTLLGAVRHQGFIPWDYDIDLGMLRWDYNRFREIAAKELPRDIFFQNSCTDPAMAKWSWLVEARLRDRYSNYISADNANIDWHNGIQIDLFVYDRDPFYDYSISNSYERSLSKSRIHIKREEIITLKTASFEGYNYPVPTGYDSYLKRCFGNYMQLPPVHERKMPVFDITAPCDHKESLVWGEN